MGGGDIRVDQSAQVALLHQYRLKNLNCHESCITTRILMHNENEKKIKVALNTTYEDTISILVRTIYIVLFS